MIIMKAFWVLLISVVRRVTSEGVLNLSMFEKENSWIFPNSPLRISLPIPMLATEAQREASAPQTKDSSAMATILPPVSRT